MCSIFLFWLFNGVSLMSSIFLFFLFFYGVFMHGFIVRGPDVEIAQPGRDASSPISPA